MIQRATATFTAQEVGLVAIGLIMINPKKLISEMKLQMKGKEIEKLINKHVNEGATNCVFGRR